MRLDLQFGWGMMNHSRELVRAWHGGTVILSPRDLDEIQLQRLSDDINRIPGGRVILDPQLYLPRADHERLRSHSYWPDSYATGAFWSGSGLDNLLQELIQLNSRLNASALIAPGLLATAVSNDWLTIQGTILESIAGRHIGLPVLATIALSSEALRSEDQIAELLETAAHWEAEGFYVVAEHPGGNYLVSDPEWLANILDLCAGLRLLGKQVVLGYCNHQMLIAATAKIDAISSGTWMNVRSFPPDKFRQNYEEEIKQRATWYYCPQALSEYKLPFLDVARRVGRLDRLRPEPEFDDTYTRELFEGAQPTTIGLSEQSAFRHYLSCLRVQAEQSVRSTFDETADYHEHMLDRAESLLQDLRANGIRGQLRDFSDSIDVNRAALAVLKSTRGAVLRRRWNTL
jgi:hypothetical protein